MPLSWVFTLPSTLNTPSSFPSPPCSFPRSQTHQKTFEKEFKDKNRSEKAVETIGFCMAAHDFKGGS